MTQYGMIIDLGKCNGCYNCFIACKDEYCGNDHPPYSLSQPLTGQFWMRMIEKERGAFPKVKVSYIPVPCMHCEDAKCIEMSESGEVYRRPDGIVIIDLEKAAGKKEIVNTCPYRVIYWNEEKNIPQKCTLCAHLLDKGWKEPRCVEACPTGALSFGDFEDPDSSVSKLRASEKPEVLHPEYGLQEKVLYIDLPRRFIAGTVILADIDDEYAKNASVTVKGEDMEKTVKTNSFGDFEIEGIEAEKEYTVTIEYAGYIPETIIAQTKTDVYMGEITLDPET